MELLAYQRERLTLHVSIEYVFSCKSLIQSRTLPVVFGTHVMRRAGAGTLFSCGKNMSRAGISFHGDTVPAARLHRHFSS